MVFEKYIPKLYNLCIYTITYILCGKKFHILSRRKEESAKRTDVNNKRENYGVIMSNTIKWATLPQWPMMPHRSSFLSSALGKSICYIADSSKCEPGNLQDVADCISQNFDTV